jgi:perosamine synthetase
MSSSQSPSPAEAYIPLCAPTIRGNEWKYVKECLDTTWVSSVGAYVEKFERAAAQVVGTEHAVATTSGTAALHVALLLAGVQPEDEVLVSTLTFIAPANAIRYVGAWPIFIDADSKYWQMDPERVRSFLESECQWRDGGLFNLVTGRRVRAILPVHILGHPVDMDPILELARKYELIVIEDATESLGAQYKGRNVGSLGDIACLSFNGNKLITTGGGGMIVTNNTRWAERAKYLTTQAKDDAIEYVHSEIGFNYRLTNIQAAIGMAQIEQLGSYIRAKRTIAERYEEGLKDLTGITPMSEASWARSTFWLYTILVDGNRFQRHSRDLLRYFGEFRIQTRPLWQPLHLSRAHRPSFLTDCTRAERLYEQALSLPSSVGLTPADQDRVLRTIESRQGHCVDRKKRMSLAPV